MGEKVSLLYHIKQLNRERDKRYQQRFDAQEKALIVALTEFGSKVVLLNELRGDVATKTEFGTLKERIDRMDGQKDGMSLSAAVFVTCITILLSVAGLYVALHK